MSGKKKQQTNSSGGFVVIRGSAMAEKLRPTERQQDLLRQLSEWQKYSAKTRWLLGEPVP